eukprot:tig00000802_g4259.t1
MTRSAAFAVTLLAPGLGEPASLPTAGCVVQTSAASARAGEKRPQAQHKRGPRGYARASSSVQLTSSFVPSSRLVLRRAPGPSADPIAARASLRDNSSPIIPPPSSPLRPNVPPPFERKPTPPPVDDLRSFRERKPDDVTLHEAHDEAGVSLQIVERRVRGHGHMFVIRARGQDRPGLLADILGTLHDFQYPAGTATDPAADRAPQLFHAHIKTDSQFHAVHDNFYVRFGDCSPFNIAGDGVQRLFDALLSVVRNDKQYTPAHGELGEGGDVSEEQLAGVPDPAGSLVTVGDHPEEPGLSLVEIKCKDQAYLAFEVTSALKEADVSVLSLAPPAPLTPSPLPRQAEISTDWDGNVHDRIVVSGPDGGRLGPEQREAVAGVLKRILRRLEYRAIQRKKAASK